MTYEMQRTGDSTTSTDSQTRPLQEEGETSSQAASSAAPPEVESKAAANDLRVAQLMFYGGFALLPWLWFVSWLHFRKAAKLPNAHPTLASYVRRSLVGSIIGGVLFGAWVITFSFSWRSWGEAGRALLLVTPPDDEL